LSLVPFAVLRAVAGLYVCRRVHDGEAAAGRDPMHTTKEGKKRCDTTVCVGVLLHRTWKQQQHMHTKNHTTVWHVNDKRNHLWHLW